MAAGTVYIGSKVFTKTTRLGLNDDTIYFQSLHVVKATSLQIFKILDYEK